MLAPLLLVLVMAGPAKGTRLDQAQRAFTSGDYDGGTKSCIQSRFRGAKVPAYGGDPKTFGWSISL